MKHTTITYKGSANYTIVKIQGSEPELVLNSFARYVTDHHKQSIIDILDIQWHKANVHITYTVN